MDCYAYALAAAMHPQHRLHRWSEAQWEKHRQALEPATGDLFGGTLPDGLPAGLPPPPPKPRLTSRASSWG